LNRHLSNDARQIWMCALVRLNMTSVDAGDVSQPLPSAALSCQAGGHHHVMIEAPGYMHRDGTDLIFPLFSLQLTNSWLCLASL